MKIDQDIAIKEMLKMLKCFDTELQYFGKVESNYMSRVVSDPKTSHHTPPPHPPQQNIKEIYNLIPYSIHYSNFESRGRLRLWFHCMAEP